MYGSAQHGFWVFTAIYCWSTALYLLYVCIHIVKWVFCLCQSSSSVHIKMRWSSCSKLNYIPLRVTPFHLFCCAVGSACELRRRQSLARKSCSSSSVFHLFSSFLLKMSDIKPTIPIVPCAYPGTYIFSSGVEKARRMFLPQSLTHFPFDLPHFTVQIYCILYIYWVYSWYILENISF
jgi:hypothetical protein